MRDGTQPYHYVRVFGVLRISPHTLAKSYAISQSVVNTTARNVSHAVRYTDAWRDIVQPYAQRHRQGRGVGRLKTIAARRCIATTNACSSQSVSPSLLTRDGRTRLERRLSGPHRHHTRTAPTQLSPRRATLAPSGNIQRNETGDDAKHITTLPVKRLATTDHVRSPATKSSLVMGGSCRNSWGHTLPFHGQRSWCWDLRRDRKEEEETGSRTAMTSSAASAAASPLPLSLLALAVSRNCVREPQLQEASDVVERNSVWRAEEAEGHARGDRRHGLDTLVHDQ